MVSAVIKKTNLINVNIKRSAQLLIPELGFSLLK
jgi:hypothetical protein